MCDLRQMMEEQLFSFKAESPKFTTTDAVAHEDTVLTLEKIVEANNKIKSETLIYVIASEMIPEDAHGVLFVRKEDAEKWNKTPGPRA